jgi:protocatechuate 3,4-dioxygenase beta subunit
MTHFLLVLLLAASGASQGVIGGGVSGLPQAPQPRDPRAATVKGTGSISGRVTAADTGLPIRRAVVTLAAQRRATHTDHEGRYQFTQLPPGQYTIFANPGNHRADYQSLPYGATLSTATGMPNRVKPIELADGQEIANADIALPRSGVITGTVLDVDGQPLSRLSVSVLAVRPGSEPMQRGGSSTDDRGQYRIFGLPAGDYIVRANPQQGGPPVDVEGDALGFAPTYAPNTPVMTEAMRVRVGQAGEAVADIRLVETRVFRISGILVNSRGEPHRNSSVMLARANEAGFSSFGSSVSATGEFTFRGVPPGTYEVVGRYMPAVQPGAMVRPGADGQEFASVTVEVGTGDVENLLLSTRPGATVTGRIVLEGAVPEGRRANVFVQTPARQQFMGSPTVEVVDTAFTLKNVFTPVLLRGSFGGTGWGLKAVLLRGRDITDQPTAFTDQDSGHLQVVFTASAPSIEGMVTDERGQPVTEASIMVFGEDPETWGPHSSYSRRSSLDKEGRYKLVGLREGRYFAVAVPPDVLANIAQPTREFLESLSKVAARVVLNPGETRTVDLPLVRFQQ